MSIETVLPIWNALRNSFQKKITQLSDEDINMKLGDNTVVDLIYHTAEVEVMFADWYFNVTGDEKIEKPKTVKQCVHLLELSNNILISGMKQLPEADWYVIKQSKIGSSTPLEVVGRLMNHAGIHSGQISFILKYGERIK